MLNIFNKILDRKYFLYFSVFYLLYKYTFFSYGTLLTYMLFLYAILIFVKDIVVNKGIYKFPGWQFAYLMCISSVLSCFVVAHKINVIAIKGISIFFINFFMYLPMFYKKDKNFVIDKFEFIFKIIILYSLIKNIFGLVLYYKGVMILDFFGGKFGGEFGKYRLVTVRETANETGWFAIFSIAASLYFILKYKTYFKKDNKYLLFLIFNIFVQTITYVLSGNRSSIIGVLGASVCIFYAFGVYKNSTKTIKMAKIISIFCFIFIFLYILIRIYLGVGSDSIRYDMYLYGIYLLPHTNVLFGSSFINLQHDLDANFDLIWNEFEFKTSRSSLKTLTYDANAHNVFIQQLNTNGLIGVFILMCFFIWCFVNLKKFITNINDFKYTFLESSVFIFFIIFGFLVGNISWSIVSTMTCFVNLFFFLSVSAITI